jgi:CBS domain-containing protein
MQVEGIMTRTVECCTPDTPLQQAAQMMNDCNCGLIPVVQDKKNRRLVGVITDRDICCRAVAKGMDTRSATVAQCMSTDVHTCTPHSDLDDCTQIMAKSQVRRIPIISDQGDVVGIVAQADIALSQPPSEAGQTVRQVSRPYVA